MIGKCPSCGIYLKEGPFGERNTNEVVLTLKYRDIVENRKIIPSIEEAGYCLLCNATIDDHKKQKKLFLINSFR